MKLRWSALSIFVTFIITSFAIATLAPQPHLTLPGQGTTTASPAGGDRAVPAPAGATMRGDLQAYKTWAATAAPLPTATPTPRPTATLTPVPVLSRAIFVDQDAQLVHVYENGVEIRAMPCSTGLPTSDKATLAWSGVVGAYVGTFYSFGTYQDEGWSLFGDVLIHGAPYTWQHGVKVYQDLGALGQRPASHGCIRISPEDALWLTEWNPSGVPCTISPLTREFAP